MAGILLISRHLPGDALTLARAPAAVRLSLEDRRLEPHELGAQPRDAEGLVCHLTDTIDAAVLARAPRLRVVATVAVGYNNIDVAGSAHLVNAARGPVVHEAALVHALREGWIAGAGLDVSEEEPRVHPGLLECPNAGLAPHIASASHETRLRMPTMAVEDALAVLEGRRPAHPVNPAVREG